MKKLIFITFITGIFFSFLLPFLNTPTALALTTCAYTKLGDPQGVPVYPPECQGSGGPMQKAVVELARKQISPSITYVWGAPPGRNWPALNPQTNSPKHFDCSGLAGWVWYWASGGKISLEGQTSADWITPGPNLQKFGPEKKSELQPGDLVYFTSGRPPVGHVGIYSGQGPCGASDCFIHIYSNGLPAKEQSLATRNDFIGFLRPVIN